MRWDVHKIFSIFSKFLASRELRLIYKILINVTGFIILFLIILSFYAIANRMPLPLLVVTSRSMVPTLEDGDLILYLPLKDIRVGDIAVFHIGGRLMTHRVVDVVKANGSVIGIITKGDASRFTDQDIYEVSYTPLEHVFGKVVSIGPYVLKIPKVGFLMMGLIRFSSTRFGLTVIIISIAIVLIAIDAGYINVAWVEARVRRSRFSYVPLATILVTILIFILNLTGSYSTEFTVIIDPRNAGGVLMNGVRILNASDVEFVNIRIRNIGIVGGVVYISLTRNYGDLISASRYWVYVTPYSSEEITLIINSSKVNAIGKFRERIFFWSIPFGYMIPPFIFPHLVYLNPTITFVILNTILILEVMAAIIIGNLFYEKLRSRQGGLKSVNLGDAAKSLIIIAFITLSVGFTSAYEYLIIDEKSKLNAVSYYVANVAYRENYWAYRSDNLLVIDFKVVGYGEKSWRSYAFYLRNYDDESHKITVNVRGDIAKYILEVWGNNIKLWDRGSQVGSITISRGGSVGFSFLVYGYKPGKVTGEIIIYSRDIEKRELCVNTWTMYLKCVKPLKKVIINEVEANPPGYDPYPWVIEWIELYNPSKYPINVYGWILKATHGRPVSFRIDPLNPNVWLPQGTVIPAKGYILVGYRLQWLDNRMEVVQLYDRYGNLMDFSAMKSDWSNNDYTWQRIPDGGNYWKFKYKTPANQNDP